MTSGVVAATFAALTFLLTLFGVVFIGGKIAQTVHDHDGRLGDHGTRLDGLDEKTNSHGEQIAMLRGFKQGLMAGRGQSGNDSEPT